MTTNNPLKKIYHNGSIFTSSETEWVEALVTNLDKIIFTGNSADAFKYNDEFTEVIDLKGRLMLPGFIDSHVHLVMGGASLLNVDLSKASSKEEFRQILKKYAGQHNSGWITGGNWRNQNWEGTELPTKEWIDDITGDTPAFLERMDYHIGLANSAALKAAGIAKESPDPEGGVIVKNPETGEPNGLLKDTAMKLVYKVIPADSIEKMKEKTLAALDHAKKLGITSVHDISYEGHFRVFQELEKEGRLTCRIWSRQLIDKTDELTRAEISSGLGSSLLKAGGVKAFADGSLGSHTAWFFEPYEDDPENCGLPMDIVSNGSLEKNALKADAAGLQISVHAIGDRANSEMINLAEKLRQKNGNKDRRFRIEHVQHLKENDIKRFAENGIIVSAQPYHFYDDGSWSETAVGKKRLRYTLPFRSLLDNKAKMCFGSDWPVVTLDPLQGIYAAVTRRTSDGKNPNGLVPEEKITVKEAVLSYTINAAYASFEENLKGSLEPGKLADMVILDKNIFEVNPDEIPDVKIVSVVFGGRKIFSDK